MALGMQPHVLALTHSMGARGEEEDLGYKCGATSQIGESLLLGVLTCAFHNCVQRPGSHSGIRREPLHEAHNE